MMKKFTLFALTFVLVAGNLFAGGVHYGIETNTEASFVLGESDNPVVAFGVNPFVSGDSFMVKFRGVWGDTVQGLSDCLDFKTDDAISIVNSALRHIDTIEYRTDVVTAGISRDYTSNILDGLLGDTGEQDKSDILGKVEVKTEAVDFGFTSTRLVRFQESDKYVNAQYASIKVRPDTVPVTFALAASRFALDQEMTIAPWVALGFRPSSVFEIQFGFTTDSIVQGSVVSRRLLTGYGLDTTLIIDFGFVFLEANAYFDKDMMYMNGIRPESDGTARVLGAKGSFGFRIPDILKLTLSANIPFDIRDSFNVIDGSDTYSMELKLGYGIFDLTAKAEATGLIEKIHYRYSVLDMFEDGDVSAKLALEFDSFVPYVKAVLTSSSETSCGRSALITFGCNVRSIDFSI